MIKKIIGSVGFSLVLVACGGTTVPDDTPKNPDQSMGDHAAGLDIYGKQCSNCHDAEGKSKIGSTPIVSAKNSYKENGLTLEAYIEGFMPPGDSSKCDSTCSSNVAAYIRAQGWVADNNGGGKPLDPVVFEMVPGTNIEAPATSCQELPAVGETMLVKDQIKNAVGDIFAPITINNLDSLASAIPDTDSNATLDSLFLARILDLGEGVGQQVAENFDQLGINCNKTANNGSDCASKFIDQRGSLAFSRIVDNQLKQELLTDIFEPAGDFETGIKQLVKAMFVATDFLYTIERGQAANNGDVVLTANDKAKKLSWLLWSSVPDITLLQAAQNGDLNSKDGFIAQVERMTLDNRFERSLDAFNRFWIYLDPEETGNPQLVEDAIHEINMLVRSAYEKDETYADLLTTNRAFVNDRLADVYGVNKVQGANVFEEVSLNNRPGIMTRAAILAGTSNNSTSPTSRGLVVSSSMLCLDIDDPPADIQDRFPQLDIKPGQTTRQALEEVTASEAVCADCHFAMDPFGLALEQFDKDGKFRAKEGNLDIDDVVGTSILGSLNGFNGLSSSIAGADEAMGCYAQQWFIHAYNRFSRADACVTNDVKQRFIQSGGDLNELIRILVESPAMHYRNL